MQNVIIRSVLTIGMYEAVSLVDATDEYDICCAGVTWINVRIDSV